MTPLLANVPLHPSMTEAIEFLAVGQIMVLFVLGALMLFITLNGLGFTRAANKPKPAAQPAPAPAAVPAAPAVDEAIPAVLAAAVAVALEGQAYQIVRITPTRDSWASEGRRQIFSSHRVR
ncbi:OadG family transporter subunit [Haloferula sargassicola]|uniref:Uncharacterized protein n=1 Tax=Haloferula sargassicola TaxID=490096 RepID=A0ABP9UT73_9BACT